MRDAKGLETIDGMKYLASVPDNEIIKHMVAIDNILYVATDKHLYKLADGKRLELEKD